MHEAVNLHSPDVDKLISMYMDASDVSRAVVGLEPARKD